MFLSVTESFCYWSENSLLAINKSIGGFQMYRSNRVYLHFIHFLQARNAGGKVFGGVFFNISLNEENGEQTLAYLSNQHAMLFGMLG